MRCYICDWSPQIDQSLFHQGLTNPAEGEPRQVYIDQWGRPVCTHCDGNHYVEEFEDVEELE